MRLVAHDELKRVLARRECDLRFGLRRAKVKVLEVVGNRLIQRRQRQIDDQMVVAGVRRLRAGRSHAHVAQAEGDLELLRHNRAVLEFHEVDFGPGRRGREIVRALSQCSAADACDHNRSNTTRKGAHPCSPCKTGQHIHRSALS